MKNLRQLLLALLVSFTILAPGSTLADDEILIGGSDVISFLPQLAIEKGYFSDEGLKVRHTSIMSGKLSMDAVISGSVDYGVIVDSNLAFVSYQKTPIKAIAAIMSQYLDGLVYGATDSEDLYSWIRDKRVAYLPGTTSHVYLSRLLGSHGLTFADIRPTVLQPPSMLMAMRTGAVDAVSIWDPWRLHIKKSLGTAAKEVINNQNLYHSRTYIGALERRFREHPGEATKVLRALIRAERFARSNPQEALELYSKYTKLPIADLNNYWERIISRVDLKRDSVEVVQEDITWVAEANSEFGNKTARPYTELFYAAPLFEIDASRVDSSLQGEQ